MDQPRVTLSWCLSVYNEAAITTMLGAEQPLYWIVQIKICSIAYTAYILLHCIHSAPGKVIGSKVHHYQPYPVLSVTRVKLDVPSGTQARHYYITGITQSLSSYQDLYLVFLISQQCI